MRGIKMVKAAKLIFVFLMILSLVLLSACGKKASQGILESKGKPVNILMAREETVPIELAYIGYVTYTDIKKIGFKSPGKIEKINVSRGQQIEKGMVLAQLETKEMELGLRASRAQLDAANAQYNKALNGATKEDIALADLNVKKAQDAYDATYQAYEKVLALYYEGKVLKEIVDLLELELKLRESDLEQAKIVSQQARNGARDEDIKSLHAMAEQAQIDYNYKKSLVDNCTIIASGKGYIVDVLFKEGEIIGGGYPLFVISNENQVISVGISQKDMNKITIGDRAVIYIDGHSAQGEVISMSQTPDLQTRTYNVEIEIQNNSFSIGSIGRVNIIVGEERGIWIPINSIVSREEDYVYVVQDNKAIRKNITIESIKGNKAKVMGLQEGDTLIVTGIRGINDQDKVDIQN
jgi:HlyD family secretion protein